ncbi:ATP-binding protein [Paenibacillus sp. BSR1-1]|uniref:ATP-binding protein n=1 Tax=Paenibacillus sp. BSR1-1 TaxID=3020845 RepID=UPI0025B1DA30|nr:ATP-binding protein [Paenibacillus sp. BSR1-1]MDN3017571.1 ATP-binding protein [Paenibacillus sp. BSR1-1]
MNEGIRSPKLIFEEKKAIILFLWLFNLIFFSWDIYYYGFRAYTNGEAVSIARDGMGIWLYVLVLGVLSIAIFLIKRGSIYKIKYLYIYSYLCIDLIDNLMRYLGTTKDFATGNIVELLFILFSPIFVNKKYFWVVLLGFIGKDVLLGLTLRDLNLLFPIISYIVLSAIAYILLNRFYSYILSLTSAYEELRQKEKLAVIGQMAAAIGHEIRNPLSALKGFTQLQQERYPNTNEFHPIMIQEIDRINSIVDDLLYLGKPRALNFEKQSIEEIIAYTLSITQQLAERQNIKVETKMAGPLPPIYCDEKQLKQVFINLIKNAIESMPDGGRIKIQVKIIENLRLNISIEDEGYGISDEIILNLGEPFFTTKKDGTGLGLMVTNHIIKDHNGELNINSVLKQGTIVEVILPINQS